MMRISIKKNHMLKGQRSTSRTDKSAKFNGSVLTIALLASVCHVPSVSAQKIDAESYSGGKARVNQAAKLRTYSEEVASASCRLAAGIDADFASEDLSLIQANVNTILAGLRDGDAALGIPTAETYSTNIKSLASVSDVWSGVDSAVSDMLAGNAYEAGLNGISQSYRDMYDSTVILASDMSGYYSDPLELLQADAITLNFVGRQKTLLNRMNRITCGLATDNVALGTAEELAETVNLFERSLAALREGYPDAGIPKPPNEAVAASLALIHDDWIAEKPVLEEIINGAGTPENVSKVNDLTHKMLQEVSNSITLYLIATPGQEGVYRLPVDAYAQNELSNWLVNDDMIAAIHAQNDMYANVSEDDILAMDQGWRTQAKDGGGALVDQLLSHDVSVWLRDQQVGTAGLVTEVFVMDNNGLNVAQSVVTSDFWQGDEAKWQETYGSNTNAIHIAEIEFDDSTGYYQTQASMPVFDPATNEKIGAITFGINVQSLM